MYEQSKAAKRRITQPAFLLRYFVGQGLDIGAGPDGLSRYVGVLPLLRAVRDWDLPDGDAQYLAGVADASMDFVHASHCLEHMQDPRVALFHWLRAVRPGGHAIVTVPDEDMYERGVWPSRHNSDHKWTFTASKRESWSPVSVALIDLVREFADLAELERLDVVREFFRPDLPGDQTMGPVAECAIELVLRRTAAAMPPGAPSARCLTPPIGRLRLKACRRGVVLFDPASAEGAALDRNGEHAETVAAALEAMLRPGDVALDYGAGEGAAALAMARRVGEAGAVHAVADSPAHYRRLMATAALNELDGLHPHPPGVAPDTLALPACRVLRIGPGVSPQDVLAGAAGLLAHCRPLLCIDALTPARATPALERAAAQGYRAYWLTGPVAGATPWFGPAGPDGMAAALVMAPDGTIIEGLPPAISTDWRDAAA